MGPRAGFRSCGPPRKESGWPVLSKKRELPSPKGEGFGLRLKPGAVGHSADSNNLEVVVRLFGFLILNVLLPHFISHIAARGNPIAPSPQVLAQ